MKFNSCLYKKLIEFCNKLKLYIYIYIKDYLIDGLFEQLIPVDFFWLLGQDDARLSFACSNILN